MSWPASDGRPTRWLPMPNSRFDLRWGGPGGPAFISQPFANHNGGHLAFGPDGYLYVGLGDGGSGNDPEHRAQKPSELLGKMLRIDVNVPDDASDRLSGSPGQPVLPAGVRSARARRSGASGCAIRGATASTIRRAAAPARWSSATWGRTRWEEIDYEPPRPRRAQLRLAQSRRSARQRHVAAARLPAAHRSDSRIRPRLGPVDHGRLRLSRTRPGRRYPGRYFFADYVSARVWSIALIVDPATGEARAADLRNHTSDLSTPTPTGNISSFGVDADGELYLVSHSRGAILKIVGPPAAPPTPTGPRIIRP